jgi:hypothetical protein
VTDGQITNRDLYDQWRDTEKQLGGLALQVATLVAEWRAVVDQMAAGSSKMTDHETRIRALERFRWRMAGGSALAGALSGGGMASLVIYLLQRH